MFPFKLSWLKVYQPHFDALPLYTRESLARCRLLVMDFDGVFTDNIVLHAEDGAEAVRRSRADSLGLELLRRRTDIRLHVLSKESNRVVQNVVTKLNRGWFKANDKNITVAQSEDDKRQALLALMKSHGLERRQVVYIGNDVNDLLPMEEVGLSVAPNDAHSAVLRMANLVLTKEGGRGAVRELCDLLLYAQTAGAA